MLGIRQLTKGRGAPTVVGLIAVVGAWVLGIACNNFGFFEDEGINLLKALMVARGHQLYGQIVSDQAPLSTWFLAGIIRELGPDYSAIQVVAVCLGVALLCGACAVAFEMGGPWAALTAAVVLLCCAPFLKFATTVVITTPALALGLWSLYMALFFARSGRADLLLVSGTLFGLGIATKLATLYLTPVLIAALLRSTRAPPAQGWWKGPWTSIGIWLLGTALGPGLVALVTPLNVIRGQLVTPHVDAWRLFEGQAARAREGMLLAPGMTLLYLMAAFSLPFVTRCRPILAAWLGVVGVWMAVHRPLWLHHHPDFLVPLAILVGCGVASAFAGVAGARGPVSEVKPPARTLLVLGTVVVCLAQLGAHGYWRRMYADTTLESLKTAARDVQDQTKRDDWVVVDRPIVAFLADRRVPPELALISRKRLETGRLGDPEVVLAMETYRPALVALCSGRFDTYRQFGVLLRDGYRKVDTVPMRLEGGKPGSDCRVFRRQAQAQAQRR